MKELGVNSCLNEEIDCESRIQNKRTKRDPAKEGISNNIGSDTDNAEAGGDLSNPLVGAKPRQDYISSGIL